MKNQRSKYKHEDGSPKRKPNELHSAWKAMFTAFGMTFKDPKGSNRTEPKSKIKARRSKSKVRTNIKHK